MRLRDPGPKQTTVHLCRACSREFTPMSRLRRFKLYLILSAILQSAEAKGDGASL